MATYYVDLGTGSDANPGTEASPWLTITYANSNSNPGDTINISAGTMTSFDLVSNRIYTGSVDAANYPTTTMDFGGAFSINNIISDSTQFINIRWYNYNTTAQTANPTTNSGAMKLTTAGGTITWSNCVFEKLYFGSNRIDRGSFFFFAANSGEKILNFDVCTFIECEKISGETYSPLIGCATYQYTATFNQCIFDLVPATLTQLDLVFSSHANASGNPVNTITARNCIFYSTAGTVTLNGTANPVFPPPTIDMNYSDDIFFGTYSGTAVTLTNVLTTEPEFVSRANNNYNLRPDITPAVNAGTNV